MKRIAVVVTVLTVMGNVYAQMSIHGMADEQNTVFKDELVGLWTETEHRMQFVETSEGILPGVRGYEVIYAVKGGPAGRFYGYLVRLEKGLFLDLYPVAIPKETNFYQALHYLPTHSFVRIEREGEQLEAAGIDPASLGDYLERFQPEPAHLRMNERLWLTAEPTELRRFLNRHGGDEVLFLTPTVFMQKPADRMLDVGELAPDFHVPDQAGNLVKLHEFKGRKNVVLIFYPGDDTPGCTKQLCAVRDDYSAFKDKDIAFFGVNPQSAQSHRKFIEKYNLPFPLLVDEQKEMVSLYGCGGRNYTQRTVYGINKDGVIVFARRGMPGNEGILAAFEEKQP